MDVFKNYIEFMFKDLPQNERLNQAKKRVSAENGKQVQRICEKWKI